MTNAMRLKRFVRQAMSSAIHFAHGSLLIAGLFAMIVFVLPRIEAFSDGVSSSREAIGPIGVARAHLARVDAEGMEAAPMDEWRSVVEYLSRKYRIAGPAVAPLINAAGAAGAQVGLDPMLIVAVMAIESSFNPIAESPMGAQGLMQVIPRFHLDKIDKGAGNNALLDPMVNIPVGARVLKESIRRAGSLEAGLQQYAGAVGDAEAQYAAKVLGEKQRLDAVLRKGRQAAAQAIGNAVSGGGDAKETS